MKPQFKHFTLLLLLVAGFMVVGISLFPHAESKSIGSKVKATTKYNFEWVAELEEDEVETEYHSLIQVLPSLHFLHYQFINIEIHTILGKRFIESSLNNLPYKIYQVLCVIRI